MTCLSTDHIDVLIGSDELHRKRTHLASQLLDQLGLRVIILNWFVLDEGGSGGVCQRLIILFEEVVRWMQTCYHAGCGVASQTLPEKTCELTVSVGDVGWGANFTPRISKELLI